MMKLWFEARRSSLAVLLACACLLPACAQAQKITTPDEFFGFRLGSDKKMARWDKIVEYYQLLESRPGIE